MDRAKVKPTAEAMKIFALEVAKKEDHIQQIERIRDCLSAGKSLAFDSGDHFEFFSLVARGPLKSALIDELNAQIAAETVRLERMEFSTTDGELVRPENACPSVPLEKK